MRPKSLLPSFPSAGKYPGTEDLLLALADSPSDNRALTILDVSANKLCDGAFGMDDLGPAIANSKITSLNVSGNSLGLNQGIKHITNIIDKGAISSVNLLKNSVPVEQAQELVKIMQSKEKLNTLCGLSGNEAMLDFSAQGLGPGDAVLIANDISDMGALTSLNMSKNGLLSKEGGKVLGEMLKGNTLLKELDVSSSGKGMPSSKTDGSGFAKELAVGIKDNGDLSKIIFGGDKQFVPGKGKVTPEPAALQVGMTEADFSSKYLGVGGAIIISAWITHKDNGALSKLDVGDNSIPPAEKAQLQGTCDAKGVSLVCEDKETTDRTDEGCAQS
jgi:hypothetical protein